MHKTAIVTGYTGQDGTFLTSLLLLRGYKVIGIARRVSTEPPYRTRGPFDFREAIREGRLILESADLTSVHSLIRVFNKHQVHEVYNLAAQSDVRVSFDQPELTFEANAMGVMNLITVMRQFAPNAKLYQASTSELYGTTGGIQNEDSVFRPASPYAVAKLAAYWAVVNYRNEGKFACNGILFNHESHIRGGGFVTQKIVRALCDFKKYPTAEIRGLQLGNLEARRDWGYAGDYVGAMWKMLQVDEPDDFVIATGVTRSVREFVEAVCKELDFPITWYGEGIKEVGVVCGREFVTINPEFYRPVEVEYLHGDASKAKEVLDWEAKTGFNMLIRIMVSREMEPNP